MRMTSSGPVRGVKVLGEDDEKVMGEDDGKG